MKAFKNSRIIGFAPFFFFSLSLSGLAEGSMMGWEIKVIKIIDGEPVEASLGTREVRTGVQEPESLTRQVWHFRQASQAHSQATSRTGTLPIPSWRALIHPEFCNYKNLKRKDFNVSIYISIILNYISDKITTLILALKCLALIAVT